MQRFVWFFGDNVWGGGWEQGVKGGVVILEFFWCYCDLGNVYFFKVIGIWFWNKGFIMIL